MEVARGAVAQLKRAESTAHGAFTLLEVILAIAILAGALATLGELIRDAVRNADGTHDLMRAELLAETIMSQVQSGELALGSSIEHAVRRRSELRLFHRRRFNA